RQSAVGELERLTIADEVARLLRLVGDSKGELVGDIRSVKSKRHGASQDRLDLRIAVAIQFKRAQLLAQHRVVRCDMPPAFQRLGSAVRLTGQVEGVAQ